MTAALRRARPTVVAAIAALLLVGALTAGCSRLNLNAAIPKVIQPAIIPSPGSSGYETVDLEFPFEESSVRLSVPVDQAVYVGAVAARKSAIFIGEEPANWTAGYYRAFVDERHQQQFYESLLDALHQIRDDSRLDASRYVELVTAMVQGLEYRTDPSNLAPKFPIETFGDGYGDCDDKALLAAGLLSKDGYDVAILLFSKEKHVALGIKAPGLDYKGTGYAYAEVTEASLVGIAPEELVGAGKLESDPEVIRIGNGAGEYAAGDQIVYIRHRLTEAADAAKKLKAEVDAGNDRLESEQAELKAAKRELDAIRDPSAFNRAVKQYNDRVAAYNRAVEKQRTLVGRYNAIVDALTYESEHRTARPRVYERLRALEL